jgi:ATP-binding cassette subfamily B protein
MRRLRELLPYLARYRARVAAGIGAILAAAALGLVAPALLGAAVDDLAAEPALSTLVGYGGLLLGVAVVQGIFNFLQRRILVAVSRDVEFDLRNDYFAHLERLDAEFYRTHRIGDLMARSTSDLGAVRMICGPAIMYGTHTLATAAGALAGMLWIDPPLTLVAVAALPVVALVTKTFGEKIHHHFEASQREFAALSARVQENLAGVRVVRAYAREATERASFAVRNGEYVEANLRLARWQAAFHPALQGLVGLGFAGVLGFGGARVLSGDITVGGLVAFHFFLGKLVWPMIAVGWVINLAQRGAASWGRLRAILDRAPAIADPPAASRREPAGGIRGALSFRDLTVRHRPEVPPSLAGIRLEIPAGATVGIVGRTGAGKSTLLSLVPRLVDPPPGTLELDGVDVRDLPLGRLRGAIAMVPQESFLFSATIAENVAVGRPEATRAEIEEAVALAGLDADLEAFPRGLDTRVGERGVTLSGGQRQRVALARALLARPRILLLDDCLSALDARTEARVLDNVRRLLPGRTVLIVAHRVSTVEAADFVVLLERGEIVERGTHVELLARGGRYAALARMQRLEEELAVAAG